MEIKVTKTHKLNAIIAVLENTEFNSLVVTVGDTETDITKEDLIEFCNGEIEALAKKAAKAKESAAKKKTDDPLLTLVTGALTAEPQVIADITAKVAETDPEVTVAKVTYRLRVLSETGVATKSEVTVSGSDGKKRTIKAYALA